MGVLHKEERPDPPADCPPPFRALMIDWYTSHLAISFLRYLTVHSWDTVPEKRPTMGDVAERILKMKDDSIFAEPPAAAPKAAPVKP